MTTEKFKIFISVLLGTIFGIVPLYQIAMYGLHLSDKIDYYFVVFCLAVSLVLFWGRLKALAKSIQAKAESKIKEH